MELQQAGELFNDFMILFPSVAEHVNKHSRDADATIEKWIESFQNYEMADGMVVFSKAANNTIAAPEPWNFFQWFHDHARKAAMIRTKTAPPPSEADLANVKDRQQVLEQRKRNEKRVRTEPEMFLSKTVAKMCEYQTQWENGLISTEERDREIDRVADEACKEIDARQAKGRGWVA